MLPGFQIVRPDRHSWTVFARLFTLATAIITGVAAFWVGLAEMGVAISAPPTSVAEMQGILLINGCFGSLLCLGRAEKLDRPPAYLSGVAVAGGTILAASGYVTMGAILVFLGSAGLTGLFIAVLVVRLEAHTLLMGVAAAVWTASNALWASGWGAPDLVFWWATFLVWSIVGLRIELARVGRPSSRALALLVLPFIAMLAGLGFASSAPEFGARLVGGGLVGLAAWLLVFDLARAAVRAPGMTGYIGACLLSAFAWLSIAGVSLLFRGAPDPGVVATGTWAALFVGVVLLMAFAHAPIVLSSSPESRLSYSGRLYVGPVLFQGALFIHLLADLWFRPELREAAGLGLVTSLVLFGILFFGQLGRTNLNTPAPTVADTTTTRHSFR